MNILFLMGRYPNYGGVEKVSTVLANEFVGQGMNVSIVSFQSVIPELLQELNDNVKVYHFPERKVLKDKNVKFLSELISTNKIDIVLNQWCLPFYVTMLIKKAIGRNHTKLLSIHHNVPDQNSQIQEIQIAIDKKNRYSGRLLLNLKLKIVKIVTRHSMRYVYKNSDFYVLLSESFKENFKRITNLNNISKVISITNPLTRYSSNSNDFLKKKKNQIIYVGRVENNQKRIFRLVEIWEKISDFNWELVIVGDGPDLQELKEKSKNLKNIYFEGFQNPEHYFKNAKILIMVSEYEGLPLVLAESQSFGVVPVVYNSFSSLLDIVDDNITGKIIEPVDGNFASDEFIKSLTNLIQNESVLQKMSRNSVKNAERFHINNIVSVWKILFHNLLK